MQRVGYSSFKGLSRAANVSDQQILRLRRGEIAQMRVETLLKLSQALQISLHDLLNTFAESSIAEGFPPTKHRVAEDLAQTAETAKIAELQHEYARLQATLAQQRQEMWQEFQQSSLQVLESLVLQLPTAAYAAQQNPQVPAVKLLPLLRPIDQLLQHWGIEAIAPVGAEIPYDPQQHQLMEGTAAIGTLVRVRYTGYRQGETLLYRAKVSPVAPS